MVRPSLAARAKAFAVTPALLGFLASARLRRHAFGFYRVVRRVDPVHQSPFGVTVLSGHTEVSAALRNPALGSDESRADVSMLRLGPMERILGGGAPEQSLQGEFIELHRHLLLFRDPPDHTRLRGLIAKAFTPKRVQQFSERVEEIVDDLLSPALGRGGFELMHDFAYPLPARVICELLGVPAGDHDLFIHHAPALAVGLDPSPMRTAASVKRANEATVALSRYLDTLVERRRNDPADDLLSALITTEEDGTSLSHDELIATVLLLILAGHETTANVLGNSMLRLLKNRPALDDLAALDETGAKVAVEELLRLDGPVHMAERITLEPVQIGGIDLPAGRILVLLIASANRDPAVFAEPERLRFGRSPNPHLAFGGGAHFCIGAALARLELRIALQALARQLPPATHLSGVARQRPSFTLRGIEALPLAW
jgi:cytochrome P450